MEHLKELTEQVCRLARETGAYLKAERRNFRPEVAEEKHEHDYVSYVDREAERRIVGALHELLPEAGFVTEEGPAGLKGEELRWVVDPLDGTTNFLHNHAPYCVSIALCRRRERLMGVVYDPCREECFYAWKGGGAWMEGERIGVTATQGLEGALMVVELPYDAERYRPTALHLLERLYGRVAGVRMMGSAALALCYVAAGRLDAWLEAYIGPWDMAAGALMVEEAGGRVTDFLGREAETGCHHIVATNGGLHQELLQVVAEQLPRL